MTDQAIKINIDYSETDSCYIAKARVGPGQIYMEHGQTQVEALNNIHYALVEVLKAEEAELAGLTPGEDPSWV